MELTISHSSLRVPPFLIRRHFKASSHDNMVITTKPKIKNIKSSNFPLKGSNNKLIPPVGLYGESGFSMSLLYGQDRHHTIRVCAKAESADHSDTTLAKILRFGSICYRFTRPLSLYGTLVWTISFFARVLVQNPHLFKWPVLLKAFPGLIVMIFSNTYYNAINQIYDADIDRINKPFLPIPAGDFSLKQAWFLTIFYLLGSLLILRLMNADHITTSIFCLGLVLGTFYSAPPFRFKASSIATSIVNPTLAVIQNVGLYYATTVSVGLPFQWSPSFLFIATFITLHFLIITNMKDLPDIEGDLKHNIRTFTAMLGPKKITSICVGILLSNYVAAVVLSIYMPQAFNTYVMAPVHAILGFWTVFEVRKLDQANYGKEASNTFFAHIWRLLNLELLIYPFI